MYPPNPDSVFSMCGHDEDVENSKTSFSDEKLEEIYQRVIDEPNRNTVHRGFVRCPECGEEILMIPTLRVMGEAIENHIQKHRETLKANPVRAHRTAIAVRLALVGQVLRQSCKAQIT
jgi:hypothetical protein